MNPNPVEQALLNYDKIKQLLKSPLFPEDVTSSANIPAPTLGQWTWRCQGDFTTPIG
jgi:hypothetical protein